MTAQTPITLDTSEAERSAGALSPRPRDVDRRPRGQGRRRDDRAAKPRPWRRRHPRAARRAPKTRAPRSPPRAPPSTKVRGRTQTASNRARVLLKVADLIDRDREALALMDTLECGKPIAQGARRDRRRGRHLAICGVARSRALGRELRQSRARPPRLRAAGADRRGVDHHAMEFPAPDRVAEAAVRARRRLHLRGKAERDDVCIDAPSRRAARRGGPAGRRVQHRHRLRPRGRRTDDVRPGRRHDLLHRLDQRRARRGRRGRRDPQEGVDGARRQEPAVDLPRRRHGRGARRRDASAPISTRASAATPVRG